ncbi:hypothetical protein EDB81DRAFT_643572 [Dactylonectria macrodidyma]|uniref:Uncharacterized protein n=1 Tax=Dactylonectria macrodidyma TaxID=307937 RepID=A0A9P9FGZ2_9HYPO|nr:hypothetical protein EDB81DRAFT_643572 [Dactylonectria macrodidyma]
MGESYSMQMSVGPISQHPHHRKFLNTFYNVSDAPGETHQCVNMITEDATYILTSEKAVGRASEFLSGVTGFYRQVRNPICEKRNLDGGFPFGTGSPIFMPSSIVELKLKNGNLLTIDRSGRAQHAKGSIGGCQFQFCQVYLVRACLLAMM